MIVGLSGYARSGKDTVADILVKEAGFVRVAFADKLREAAYALNPIVAPEPWGEPIEAEFILDMPTCTPFHLQHVIDRYGWDGYKDTAFGPEIRRILQRLGTEVGREILGDNVWVNAATDLLDVNGNYVFTDCRFPNEARHITMLGGQVWRITRPEVGPANDHISEVGLDSWNFDVNIYNGQDISYLRERVLSYARGL